jgi:hypothetical protein
MTPSAPSASLPIWFDSTDSRSCRIHVFEDGCRVEMRVPGRSSLTQQCPTMSEAVAKAEALRRAFMLGQSEALWENRH